MQRIPAADPGQQAGPVASTASPTATLKGIAPTHSAHHNQRDAALLEQPPGDRVQIVDAGDAKAAAAALGAGLHRRQPAQVAPLQVRTFQLSARLDPLDR